VLYVGGAIDLDTQYKMNAAGNVIAGELRELNANPNNSRFRHTDGTLVIDPHAGDSLSDVALYTSYSDPVLPRIDVYITENGFNYTAGSAGDIYITTAPGINFSMSGSGIAGGIIHGKGNISISSIGNVYADIYADGDLYISNGAFYGDIYCRGNLTINGGSYHGDITCDGNISVSNLNNNGLIKSNGDVTVTDATNTGSVYAAGTITLIRANLAGVIYSSSDINIGSGKIRGIIYSVNHVKITSGCSVEGSLFAKGNVYYGPPAGEDDTMNITYSQSVINDALQDSKNEFLFSGSGDGGNTVLDDSVFVSQSVTAIGRQ
jgi:cytoskeletal protein CcmA (bactofilin family)